MGHLLPGWCWLALALNALVSAWAFCACLRRRDGHGLVQTLLTGASGALCPVGVALGAAPLCLLGAALGLCWAVPAVRGRASLFDRGPAA